MSTEAPLRVPADPNTEHCVCAAIQMPGGIVFRGRYHAKAMEVASNMGCTRQQIGQAVQGFMTSKGRFLNRYDAMDLQIEAGILPPPDGWPVFGRELYSDKLYEFDDPE